MFSSFLSAVFDTFDFKLNYPYKIFWMNQVTSSVNLLLNLSLILQLREIILDDFQCDSIFWKVNGIVDCKLFTYKRFLLIIHSIYSLSNETIIIFCINFKDQRLSMFDEKKLLTEWEKNKIKMSSHTWLKNCVNQISIFTIFILILIRWHDKLIKNIAKLCWCCILIIFSVLTHNNICWWWIN